MVRLRGCTTRLPAKCCLFTVTRLVICLLTFSPGLTPYHFLSEYELVTQITLRIEEYTHVVIALYCCYVSGLCGDFFCLLLVWKSIYLALSSLVCGHETLESMISLVNSRFLIYNPHGGPSTIACIILMGFCKAFFFG